MTQKVLIAGASGRFGSHARKAFEAADWEVRVFDRKTETLEMAAQGVDVIVNALNPQDYKDWDTEIPRITSEVIAAAKESGATVIIPGNVYNYGVAPAPWSSRTPQVACSRKGQVRIDMEAAYRASGVQVINLRSGDFIDEGVTGTWFDLVILKSMKAGKFVYPGNPDIPHAWGYLPDLGRATVALAERRDRLETFSDIAFPGYRASGREIMAAVEKLSGRSLKLSFMPWWALRIASPFWRMGRELVEMRYLWDHPHWLDGADFSEALPEFVGTDLLTAVASALPVDVEPDKAVVGAERLS